MAESTFSPGFRLSALDVVILVAGAVAATAFAAVDRWTGVAIGFVVAHFFLFCNILRMSRPMELIWAAVFSSLAVCSIQKLTPWAWTFGISVGIAVIVGIIETRRPSYHGVGWKRLNPKLPEWWERRQRRT
jgi:Na+-transporting NADH:ubiquinone oxidoreductase subunit NqrD